MEEAWRTAHANPYYRRTMRYGGERIMPFLQDAGLVGGPGLPLWRKAYLLQQPRRSSVNSPSSACH
ncbi:hypothetical protein [Streptomyces cavernicola]|uniref:Uncharacterized protein n=1 Tax=Streptomyces cavernicola TaxID=3043613 RepID=A0ABT6SDB4_9ACTN|nr:hypothetical protein [Streptomyces sp. B-S-A6]MDI3406186.1 hypothetical protein [Streptomyces sp. B-S-A6]